MAIADINTKAVVTPNWSADYVFVSVNGTTGPRKAALSSFARRGGTNTFTGDQTVNGSLTVTGTSVTFTAGNNQILINSDGITLSGKILVDPPATNPDNSGELWVDPTAGYVVKMSQG